MTLETATPAVSAPPSPPSTGFRRSLGDTLAQLAAYLQRPGVVPVLIILLWACATLPNLTVRSFIYEEGTNAEIAKDVLAHGHFLQPFVYGFLWHDKPSLLSWLIAGLALITGGVNEWSARLPAMLSVLITALLVHRVTRRYASPAASLFAALSFLFCPLLLAETDGRRAGHHHHCIVVRRFGGLVGRRGFGQGHALALGALAGFCSPRLRWRKDRSRPHSLRWERRLIC